MMAVVQANFSGKRLEGDVLAINAKSVVMRVRFRHQRLRSLGLVLGLFGKKMSMGKGFEEVKGEKAVKRHREKHDVEPLDFSFWPKEGSNVVGNG
jgi:hypothetical protein